VRTAEVLNGCDYSLLGQQKSMIVNGCLIIHFRSLVKQNSPVMDEDVLRQLLASQEGIEFSPTDEMMMMNSATAGSFADIDSMDPELLEAIQQQAVIVNRPATATTVTHTEDDDMLLEDETILERIVALKEMFPESVQNTVGTINRAVVNTSKFAYTKGRSAAWW
jgi:hypothetical protein